MSSGEDVFFEGGVEAGISLALRNEKIFVCFVAGDNEESMRWQDNFLQEPEVAAVLAKNAITVRIEENSQEAQLLSAYCPLQSSPTLILSYQGQILLKLESGSSKDHFKDAIFKAMNNLSPTLHSSPATSSVPSSNPSAFPAPSSSLDSANSSTSLGANLNRDSDLGPITPPVPQNSSAVQDLLGDRQGRLEADKKEKDAAEKADRIAKAQARQNAMINVSNSPRAKQASHAQEQRRRKEEQKLERERIMAEIQRDKEERKEKEERRRAAATADSEDADRGKCSGDGQLSPKIENNSKSPEKDCALQIRLFDGSTIRRRFGSHETLRNHVRPWIDKEGIDGDNPFTFKQILTPMPNRTISISEEEGSLSSLGLMPSATLVKVPVQRFTDAYRAHQGIISHGFSVGYSVASAGFDMISRLVGTVWGFGQAVNAPATQVRREEEVETGRSRADRQGQQQFYNGNQLNIEPRPENEEDAHWRI